MRVIAASFSAMVFGLALSGAAHAGVKQLFCDLPKESRLADLSRYVGEDVHDCQNGREKACERAERLGAQYRDCVASAASYGIRYVFTFDESALAGNEKSFVDYYSTSCGGKDSAPERGGISSTPTTITIEMPAPTLRRGLFLHINRETLLGKGEGGRTYACTVQDVQSKNKL